MEKVNGTVQLMLLIHNWYMVGLEIVNQLEHAANYGDGTDPTTTPEWKLRDTIFGFLGDHTGGLEARLVKGYYLVGLRPEYHQDLVDKVFTLVSEQDIRVTELTELATLWGHLYEQMSQREHCLVTTGEVVDNDPVVNKLCRKIRELLPFIEG